MRFKSKLKKVGNKFDKLVKGIKDLNNEKVQVGHFKEQGRHSSGLTYAELMALHNNPQASGKDWPRRPVLDILVHEHRNLNDPEIRRILAKYSSKEPTPQNNEMLLEELGEFLRDEEKSIFGSSKLASNAPSTQEIKGRNDPLVDTGDLRDRVAYRTSKNKEIKEG